MRSWRLFIALLLGIVLASTFFAGINIGADTAAKQALDQELSKILVDVYVSRLYGYGGPEFARGLSAENVTEAMNAISELDYVDDVEVISGGWYPAQMSDKNLTNPYFRLIGISENSHVRNGWLGGAPTIEENETYVWTGSTDAGLLQVGDIIPLNFTMSRFDESTGKEILFSFLLNLEVAGFVQLNDQALSIATGQYFSTPSLVFQGGYSQNFLISSWEKTFARLLDFIYDFSPSYSNTISTEILVYLKRAQLISPWDTAGSIQKLEPISLQIDDAVSKYGLYASNRLSDILRNYQGVSFGMRFVFIISALPVFFVAWYMGSTVSDVSFNLRRREIGLLLTKGFSRRQLFWMFLFEAALIGLLGGVLGIILSFTLSPWFVAAAGGEFIGMPMIGLDSIVLTVAFAVIITFLSAFRPARRASNMATVDALREYMYVENVKPYKRLDPWIAFIIGSLKMIVFLSGINLLAVMGEMARLGPQTNVLFFFLLAVVSLIDFILIFIGPFLFFWGFTKILIHGSLKFQEIVARVAKFLGDLGELATKNVQRNPARAAAVAFLIAFIIGYSIQIVGTLASLQDFGIRQVYFTVGSDVSVILSSPINASQIMNIIRNNASHIQSTTVEYTSWSSTGLGPYRQGMELRAVNPNTWLSTAYYENDLFSGSSVEKAFETMRLNNRTIILERNYAKTLNKEVGDFVSVTFGEEKTEQLTVAGFFGVEATQASGGTEQAYFYRQFWSYIPEELSKELGEDVISYSSAKILIKLESGTDSKAVADQIRKLNIDTGTVSSVAEQLKQIQSDPTFTGFLNILRLGVVFFVIAASIGTALVTFVSLRERKREASIMSIRGLSFKQLFVMLLTENLAVVTFAVLLGAAGGLIAAHGTVAALNAFNVLSYNPLRMHMVFPPDALLTLSISFTLAFASTIIPVILMAKRYSSRLEKVVREV